MRRTARALIIASSLSLPAAAAAQQTYRATPLPAGAPRPVELSGLDTGETMEWRTLDSGGGRISAGSFLLEGTVGQHDTSEAAAVILGDLIEWQGGFWSYYQKMPPCYANCDNSTLPPTLNVQDFTCFLQRYAAGDTYANCDNSTVTPTLNVQDFTCFLQNFAAGCPW
jgi:hypothetical protein